jgi:hypothetical protein
MSAFSPTAFSDGFSATSIIVGGAFSSTAFNDAFYIGTGAVVAGTGAFASNAFDDAYYINGAVIAGGAFSSTAFNDAYYIGAAVITLPLQNYLNVSMSWDEWEYKNGVSKLKAVNSVFVADYLDIV